MIINNRTKTINNYEETITFLNDYDVAGGSKGR